MPHSDPEKHGLLDENRRLRDALRQDRADLAAIRDARGVDRLGFIAVAVPLAIDRIDRALNPPPAPAAAPPAPAPDCTRAAIALLAAALAGAFASAPWWLA